MQSHNISLGAIGYTASALEAKGLGKVDVCLKIGSD